MGKQPPTAVQNVPEDNRPIDRFFWFKMSRQWVSNGTKELQDRSEKLKKAVAWFFGLGTSFIFSAILLQKDILMSIDLRLFASPLLFLFLSYCFAVFADSLALRGIFIGNEQKSIMKTHNNTIKKGKALLIISGIFLFIGFFSFPIVLGYATFINSQEIDPYINASLHTEKIPNSTNKIIKQITISGKVLNSIPVNIFIEKNDHRIATNRVHTLDNGTFHYNYVSSKDTFNVGETVFVTMEFNDGKNFKRITSTAK